MVVVLRAEKMLKPKRRGKAQTRTMTAEDDDEPAGDVDVLEAYVKSRSRCTTLVFVAADVDRTPAALQGDPEARDDCRMLGTEGRQGRDASICGRSRARPKRW